MVQNKTKAKIGRPRAYDPAVALRSATEAFWDGGFAGTSLDDLSSRTGMNRPSLYAAFGDKEALYLKTLDCYLADRRTMLEAALKEGRPIADALREIYYGMIESFLEGKDGARGCYFIATAATEAMGNPKVRAKLEGSLRLLDEGLRQAFVIAQARGEIAKNADPRSLAALASSVVHALALRARAGQSGTVLRATADAAINLLFLGSQSARRPRRGRSARRVAP